MKVRLDHIGVAVGDIAEALAFYRDGLGLEVVGVEEVSSQRVRAHFVALGNASLELLEATTPESTIAKFVARRGPGLHHVTLQVDDIDAALGELKARGVRLIDERARPGAEQARVAFIHPSAAHGVLVELKQSAHPSAGQADDTIRQSHSATQALRPPSWSHEMTPTIGIIGGSGLYDMAALTDREECTLTTPFGDPSGPYLVGTLSGQRVAFLARHGVGHRWLPSELNYRANIFGFKLLGVERILSASAVGSLKHEYRPQDILVPDQFFDRTKGRISTFFGRGLVAHVAFAHPVCAHLSAVAADAVERVGATVHRGGTYVNMEGPQFSTLAESRLYRSWGMDVIGMTNLQEAKLAREAELCYATLALVTDYDCWHPDHDSVTVDLIVANLMQNAVTAQATIAEAVSQLNGPRTCACKDALATAIITRPEHVPLATKHELAPIVGKYLA